jgi:hypothetical protein
MIMTPETSEPLSHKGARAISSRENDKKRKSEQNGDRPRTGNEERQVGKGIVRGF